MGIKLMEKPAVAVFFRHRHPVSLKSDHGFCMIEPHGILGLNNYCLISKVFKVFQSSFAEYRSIRRLPCPRRLRGDKATCPF